MLVSEIKVLSAAEIASAVDREEKLFAVPEWGGSIKLKALSTAQRDEMFASCTDNGRVDGKVDGLKLMRALCIYGVSEPTLTEEILAQRSFAVIDRIGQAVMELNGMDKGAPLTAARTF